jgi:hypothetical protein
MTTRGGNHFFVAAGGTGKSVEAARRALGSLFDREDRASQSAKRTWVARHESQLAKNLYCARGPRLWRTKGYGDVTGTTRAKSYTAHCHGTGFRRLLRNLILVQRIHHLLCFS